jgi:hypothetical protein
MSTATIPGLYYTFVRPPAEPSPLRTDIAGFFGKTRRGPVGRAVRVEGWRESLSVFGDLTQGAMTPYALRGYFDNGGEAAYVVRLLGAASTPAAGSWTAGTFDAASGKLGADWPGASGLQAIRFTVVASSPGDWANDTRVTIRYWAKGPSGQPEMELEVAPPNETVELLTGLDPKNIVDEVNAQSDYVRLTPDDLPAGLKASDLVSPPPAPSVAVIGVGTFTAASGGYQYAYCYENGPPGPVTLSSCSELSLTTGNFTNKGPATFDVTAAPDPQTKQIRVFRTKDGGATLYELPTSPYLNLTQTITDAATDGQLDPLHQAPSLSTARPGPRYWEWDLNALSGGAALPPAKQDYLNAVQLLGDEVEVALIASPDLYQGDLPDESDQLDVLYALLTQAEQLHDRLVIIDVPAANASPLDTDIIDVSSDTVSRTRAVLGAVNWVQAKLRLPLSNESILRNGAVYHPRLLVPDPLGGVAAPLLCVPCSGLVAGVVSRLDLQLGAYFTPANAQIDEAVDLSRPLNDDEEALIYAGGINLLTCSPGRGLLVWGGRVLGTDTPGGYVAHRRLIHLLVRAIRRVSEPLVFDTNGPELWLAFVRSITSVLLEAYRAGALKGERPDEAFQVVCDATTNPPENIDNGLVICEIQVAPAVPMEFITLRVSASADGKLEVFES